MFGFTSIIYNDNIGSGLRQNGRGGRQTISSGLKKKAISLAAVSGPSEPCTAFCSTSLPQSLRMVPGAAFAGSVAPIISRFFAIAFSPSRTETKIGPEDIYCLLYTSDAADERSSVDLGGRRII